MNAPHPKGYEGYQLFLEGVQTFADIEENGMYVDTDYCKKEQERIGKEIKKKLKGMNRYKEVKYWRKKYGGTFNIESNQQLSHVLFDYMKYKPKILTETGLASTSQTALEQMDIPLIQDIMWLRKMRKMKSTYIENYMRETVDNILHPFFNLHIPVSFRSSSSKINFQNQPERIAELKRIVKSAILPRKKKRLLGEVDFSGVEVSIAACYHKDPNMIKDILDPKRDMHKDMAMECYKMEEDQWTKMSRYAAKNKFVFPEFYGSYYAQCAKDLWEAIQILSLETKKGVPLKKHLAGQGIRSYQKFEGHIREVEDYMWKERYPVYNKWKETHWELYQKRGYVDLLSGFRCSGVMKKNEAINYPIQGAAFHCLLWCLIRLNRWLKDNEMRTCIIGQIHDSIVLDFHPDELNEVMDMIFKIMEEEIRAHWSWIIIPLEIEAELSPLGGSWYLKKEVKKTEACEECDCKWMYENEIEGRDDLFVMECPVCGAEYEEAA